MLAHATLQQQARSADQANARSAPQRADRAERPERPERPEQPERPERPERAENPDVVPEVNRVVIRPGVRVAPAPGIPGVQVHVQDPEEQIPPQVVDLAYGFFVMIAVMVIGWPFSRAWGRRLERGAQWAAIPPAVTDQLQRIEQAVDAMAVEVERISEAQRYLMKRQVGQVGEPAGLPAGERR